MMMPLLEALMERQCLGIAVLDGARVELFALDLFHEEPQY